MYLKDDFGPGAMEPDPKYRQLFTDAALSITAHPATVDKNAPDYLAARYPVRLSKIGPVATGNEPVSLVE